MISDVELAVGGVKVGILATENDVCPESLDADNSGGRKESVQEMKKKTLKMNIAAAVKKIKQNMTAHKKHNVKVLHSVNDMRKSFDKNHIIRPTRVAIAMVILYVLLGILYYHYKNEMSWVDSAYLVVITLMTVGYGDIPIADTGFTSFYVLTGTGVVGAAFLTVISQVLDKQENVVATSLNMARKLHRQASAKLHRRASDTLGLSDVANDVIKEKEKKHIHATKNEQINETIHHEADYYSSENLRKRESEIYRKILTTLVIRTAFFFFLILLVMFIGSLCFYYIEHAQELSYKDSIYWAIVTLCTVGFGDVTPHTDNGKVFTIFYCLLSIPLAAKAFSEISKFPIVYKQKWVETDTINQFGDSLSPELLETLLNNPFFDNEHIPHLRISSAKTSGEITKPEFLLLLLSLMGKVTEQDLRFASQFFERFDHDHNGTIGLGDLTAKERRFSSARRDDSCGRHQIELSVSS